LFSVQIYFNVFMCVNAYAHTQKHAHTHTYTLTYMDAFIHAKFYM
jgi:hypothetical protein